MSSDASASPEPAPANRLRWRPLALSLVPGVVFLLVFVWRSGEQPGGGRRFTLFDDAMISMTYAKTFADTGELVWFPGADRVQGITNPLWTLYLTTIHLVGIDGSEAALLVSLTGVAVIVAGAIVAAVTVSRVLGGRRHAAALAYVAAGTAPFLYSSTFWTLRGMEVGVLSTLLLLTVAEATAVLQGSSETARRRRLVTIGAALAVGIATRIDFAIFAVAIVGVLLVRGSSPQRRAAVVRFAAAPAIATIAAVFVIQRLYWGSWLPNTYVLKVEGYSAVDRITRGIVATAPAIPIALLVSFALVAWWLAAPMGRDVAVMAGGCVGLALAYSVWVGGDAWQWSLLLNRYVSVALPLASVIVICGFGFALDRVAEWRAAPTLVGGAALAASFVSTGLITNPHRLLGDPARFAFTVGLVIVTAFVVLLVPAWRFNTDRFVIALVPLLLIAVAGIWPMRLWRSDLGLHVRDDQQVTADALALRGLTTPDAVVATVWAGAPGYYLDRPMIDLLGKSDERIATSEPRGDLYPGHNKWDYEYSIGELRPDVVNGLWSAVPADYELLADGGYVERCFATDTGALRRAFFRADSTAVTWDDLVTCPPAP